MDKETKKCPFCGGEILAAAKKCKHCKQFIPEQVLEPAKTKTCPYCGEDILVNAKKCKHCGEWINAYEVKPQEMVKCAFCGKMVSRYAEKCPNCGEWLRDENEALSCGLWWENSITKSITIFSLVITIITFLICITLTLGEENLDFGALCIAMVASVLIPLIVFIVFFFSIYIYLLPTVIAKSKNHPQIVPIFLINLFFGETIIGWVGSMVWASTHRQGRHTHW